MCASSRHLSGFADRPALEPIYQYHERSKHHPGRYAVSMGYMDWANQPDPFRHYADCAPLNLPHPAVREAPTYDGLFATSPAAEALTADTVGRFFLESMALSAWKQAPSGGRWSLRINPSSGALYPTEAYLISGPIPGLVEEAGVFHYAPMVHRLERRCRLVPDQWAGLIAGMGDVGLLVGIATIHWRESWKYGERAFRYCNHDVGHAIAALAFSARCLGWQAQVIGGFDGAALDRLLGTGGDDGPETEWADCLVAISPGASLDSASISVGEPHPLADLLFEGTPNTLSRDHHHWPAIQDVARAVRQGHIPNESMRSPGPPAASTILPDRGQSAGHVIRQRRSAVHMDGRTGLTRDVFYQMLLRTLPANFPATSLATLPRVSLALFVHRVVDVAPGLYLLLRDPAHRTSLEQALNPDFDWEVPAACPEDLPLVRLRAGDLRQAAAEICCHQEIAGDGAFSLGMVAQFDEALAVGGPAAYPRLFWECGLVGQILYLEAEAAGVRGTGIGCFFDDVMHRLLGISGTAWQSLYHFTIGGPVEDSRLLTLPPYDRSDGNTFP